MLKARKKYYKVTYTCDGNKRSIYSRYYSIWDANFEVMHMYPNKEVKILTIHPITIKTIFR